VARLGAALVRGLRHGGSKRVSFIVGRDTRESGEWIERELARGVRSEGAAITSAGVLPTPAIAYVTREMSFDAGLVISASHNPFADNGIKLFSADATKFPDSWEEQIEARLAAADGAPRARGADIGRLVTYDRAEKYYVDFLCRCFPLDLAGMTVVIDCANGATCRVAPSVFRRLGARVVAIAARPDGTNINAGCGALHPEGLQRRLRAIRADVGFAFDGDGDRLISVDHLGEIRDGDYALAITGRHMASRERLKGNVVVTTVMANLGLDEALAAAGIRVLKTQVGDRYVQEEMLRSGANLGGEQSGHLLFPDYMPTGDGILSALSLLSVVRETGEPLASLATCMRKFPQVLVNVPVARKPAIESLDGLGDRVRAFELEMSGAGRVLVRYSGTEPLARVMIEGADAPRIQAMADELASLIRAQIGQ